MSSFFDPLWKYSIIRKKTLNANSKGHHGMGLHVRPLVGNQSQRLGAFRLEQDANTLTAATTNTFTNAFEYVSHFQQLIQKELSSQSKELSVEEKLLFDQKMSSIIYDQLRESKTLPKPSFYFDDDFEKKRDIRLVGRTTWPEAAFGKRPGEEIKQFSKYHDIELFKKHVGDGVEWVSDLIGPALSQEIQNNSSVSLNKDFTERQFFPVKIFNSRDREIIRAYATQPQAFGTSRKYPEGVSSQKEMQEWVAGKIDAANNWSQTSIPIGLNFQRRAFYRPPTADSYTLTLNGKSVQVGLQGEDNKSSWGISIGPQDLKKFYDSYRKSSNGSGDKKGVMDDVIHEYGHYLEHISPTISKITEDFLERRTKNAAVKKLADIFPNNGYKETEVYLDGNFVSPYVGKIYQTIDSKKCIASSEVLSVGLQQLFANPVHFLSKDPEHFALIISAMKGIPLS